MEAGIRALSGSFLGCADENHKISVRVDGASAEIRNKNLPDTVSL
jgi:hypothetical protein